MGTPWSLPLRQKRNVWLACFHCTVRTGTASVWAVGATGSNTIRTGTATAQAGTVPARILVLPPSSPSCPLGGEDTQSYKMWRVDHRSRGPILSCDDDQR